MAKAPIDIRSLARTHTEDAIRVLASIMNDPKAQARPRVMAATVLLDRGWGKAKETHEHGITNELSELLQMIDGRTRGLPNQPQRTANGQSNGVH